MEIKFGYRSLGHNLVTSGQCWYPLLCIYVIESSELNIYTYNIEICFIVVVSKCYSTTHG